MILAEHDEPHTNNDFYLCHASSLSTQEIQKRKLLHLFESVGGFAWWSSACTRPAVPFTVHAKELRMWTLVLRSTSRCVYARQHEFCKCSLFMDSDCRVIEIYYFEEMKCIIYIKKKHSYFFKWWIVSNIYLIRQKRDRLDLTWKYAWDVWMLQVHWILFWYAWIYFWRGSSVGKGTSINRCPDVCLCLLCCYCGETSEVINDRESERDRFGICSIFVGELRAILVNCQRTTRNQAKF